jgi:hypothetical protein
MQYELFLVIGHFLIVLECDNFFIAPFLWQKEIEKKK